MFEILKTLKSFHLLLVLIFISCTTPDDLSVQDTTTESQESTIESQDTTIESQETSTTTTVAPSTTTTTNSSMTSDIQIEIILTNNVDCKIREYISNENLDVNEYLQKLGTNNPKTRETAEICILFSEDLPQSIKDDHREFHDKMFNVLGAYDRYVHALYEVEGDNTELLSALNKLGAYGGDINDIMTIYERRTCLGGFGRFNDFKYSEYSFCNQPNPLSASNEKLEYKKRYIGRNDLENRYGQMQGWAHEYFHHYQRAHHLERTMGMEGDCCGSADFTNTPAWFIEGQANLFPTLFWKENFNDLTISKENQITFNQILNRENELYAKICSAIICDLDSVYKQHKKAFLGDGEYSCPEFTELDDYRDTRICGKMYGWVITAAYMGYISSYQTAFVDFFNDINKLGFDGSMEKHYGLTKLEFYKQYSDFMRSDPSNLTPPPGFFPSKLSEEVNFFLVDSGN